MRQQLTASRRRHQRTRRGLTSVSPPVLHTPHGAVCWRMDVYILGLHGWRRDVVASVVRRMNEVTLRRARLVLGWVTVFGRVYHHGM